MSNSVPPGQKVNIAVLVSGRGSNLAALLEAEARGQLPAAQLRVVLSNNPDSRALQIAESHGIEAVAIDHREFKGDRAGHEKRLIEELDKRGCQYIVLAGYMRLLTNSFIAHFPNRIINVHPSLLPSFPGVDAQRQALEYGVRYTGCTVHFVDEDMDAGPIIAQRVVRVHSSDTRDSLAERILEQEHRLLPYALDLLTRGRLQVAGRRVFLLPGETSFDDLESTNAGYLPVLVATSNEHKVEEIRLILSEVALSFLTIDLFGNLPEPVEDAPDFLGNAFIKARTWRDRSSMWTLADDSGLEVEALGGRPGVHSARYAPTPEERIQRLLEELKDVPEAKRRARFVCAVALCGPQGEEYHEEGVLEGSIALQTAGSGGFGYDPIFLPDGFDGRTLAQLGDDLKNNISHRARAIFALKPVLEKLARGNLA